MCKFSSDLFLHFISHIKISYIYREFFSDRASRSWYLREQRKQNRFRQSNICDQLCETLNLCQLSGKMKLMQPDRLQETMYAVEFIADNPNEKEKNRQEQNKMGEEVKEIHQTKKSTESFSINVAELTEKNNKGRADDVFHMYQDKNDIKLNLNEEKEGNDLRSEDIKDIDEQVQNCREKIEENCNQDNIKTTIAETLSSNDSLSTPTTSVKSKTPQIMMLLVPNQGQLAWYVPAHETSTWTNYCSRDDANR